MSGSKSRFLNRYANLNYNIRYFLNFKDLNNFKIKNKNIVKEKHAHLNEKNKNHPLLFKNTNSDKKIDKKNLLLRKFIFQFILSIKFRINDDFEFYENK
jgi:hypothetical protein